MNAVTRRISRLERHFGTDGRPGVLFFLCRAGWQSANDVDRCFQILDQLGLLPKGQIVLNFLRIPDHLNAEETETYLRENAEDICTGRSLIKVDPPANPASVRFRE